VIVPRNFQETIALTVDAHEHTFFAMKGSANQVDGIPCPGCPIYRHIPDTQFRFPSCELCHWPAIGVGSAHVWRCAYCRHWNEHGQFRPRVSAVLLRLADVEPAAYRLDVVDPRYGRYLLPRTRPSPCQPRAPWRPGIAALAGAPGWPGVAGRPDGIGGSGRRVAGRDRAGRPVYARATVAGLPVLIIGGDRPYPYPLGLGEHDPEPCAFGSRATRIACPCAEPAPCLHGQALYAHVVAPDTPPAAPTAPAAPAPPVSSTLALSRSAC
jgi:hypothetical protein